MISIGVTYLYMTAAKFNLENKFIALFIFIVIGFFFLMPLFVNLNNWGSFDWDQHFFYNEAARKTILKYKQVPLWNPYYCGGNVLLAHPES